LKNANIIIEFMRWCYFTIYKSKDLNKSCIFYDGLSLCKSQGLKSYRSVSLKTQEFAPLPI